MREARTQVVIVGAGPAGLSLAHLLWREGIDAVVLEARSREYCERRVRAGLLEPGTVEFLSELGLDRARREGMTHHGIELHFGGERHRIPIAEIAGMCTTIYPQQEVVKDLLAASDAIGGRVLFEVADVTLHDLTSTAPVVRFRHRGEEQALRGDIVAGCDGFHGVSRAAIPDSALRTFESEHAATWFGVLAEVAPTTEELVYGLHERGYAMHSMRGPNLTRLYFQYDPADPDHPSSWSQERVWEELGSRLATADGWDQPQGPIVDRVDFSIRAFIVEPMRYGRLFLAGDAAHIVPPTGGKGLNAAVWDVKLLAEVLVPWFAGGGDALLDAYSPAALRRDWQMLQFSVWMTEVLAVRRPGDAMELRLKHAELEQLVAGGTLTRSFAERYLGVFDPVAQPR